MNGKQYEAILKALADKLLDQEREISLQEYQLKTLKEALQKAESGVKPTTETA